MKNKNRYKSMAKIIKKREKILEEEKIFKEEVVKVTRYGEKEKSQEVKATKYGIKEKVNREEIPEGKVIRKAVLIENDEISLESGKILNQGEIKISKEKALNAVEVASVVIGEGDIKVTFPYEVKEVISLNIDEIPNKHGELKVKCIIDDSTYESVLKSVTSGKSIKVSSKNQTIFIGSIYTEKLRCVKEVYYLEIEAKSFTYELDIKKHTRIFPSADMTYKEIIDYVLGGHSGVNYIGEIKGKPSGIILQYKETDFEFIKRLVSKENKSIIPDSSYKKPRFTIGVVENGQSLAINNPEYSVLRNIAKFNKINSSCKEEFSERNFICYSFKSTIPLRLGEKVQLNGRILYINKVEGEIKNSILEYTYTLGKVESLMEKIIINENIIGASFKAKVTSIDKDEMKVQFNMDRNTESIFLKYLTPFALEGAYGWFIMPEVGDTVTVQFSDENEESAYILSSNRMSGGGDSSTKSLSTPYGKSMTLNSSSINFSGGGGSVTIGESDITIESHNDITLDASNNLKINGANVSMSGGEMTQLIGPGSSIILDGDINGSARKVIV